MFKFTTKNPPPNGVICTPSSDSSGGYGANGTLQFVKFGYTRPMDKAAGKYQLYDNPNDDFPPEYIPEYAADTVGDIFITDSTYIKTGVAGLLAENCYYESENSTVISWKGPHGLNIAPELTRTSTSYTQNTSGYTDVLEGVFNIDGNDYRIWSINRFGVGIYCHGKYIDTPANVLGAGLQGDVIFIVVADTKTVDKVYYSKLSELNIDGWKLAADINMPASAGLTYTNRQGIYSFSQDGTKLCALIDCIKHGDGIHKSFKKTIIRADLSVNSVGNITFQLINHNDIYEVDSTRTESTTGTPPFQTYTLDITKTYGNADIDQTIGMGFIGNVETKLTRTLGAISGNYTGHYVSIGYADGLGDISSTITNTLNYSTVTKIGATTIHTSTYSENYSYSFEQVSNIVSGVITYDITDDFTNNTEGYEYDFYDISKSKGVFLKTNKTYQHSSTTHVDNSTTPPDWYGTTTGYVTDILLTSVDAVGSSGPYSVWLDDNSIPLSTTELYAPPGWFVPSGITQVYDVDSFYYELDTSSTTYAAVDTNGNLLAQFVADGLSENLVNNFVAILPTPHTVSSLFHVDGTTPMVNEVLRI